MGSQKTTISIKPRKVTESQLQDWNRWTDDLSDSRLRKHSRDMTSYGRMLHRRHYVSGTDGNLSIRLDASHIVTTPTGVSKRWMKPEEMVIVDMAGRKVSGKCQPSSEIQVHLTIYEMRPDIHAVVHAHPCTATAFAASGLDLTEPICSELVLTLGKIPLAPYAHPGTRELSDALRPFIKDHDAILMESHGVVTYAENIQKAYLSMEAVEHCATISLVTKLLGCQKTLNEQAVNRLLAARSKGRAHMFPVLAEQ